MEDETSDLIEAFEPTNANYEVALILLNENHARVDAEKTRILAGLRPLPRSQKASDVVGLRRFQTVTQKHIASLTAMRVPYSAFAILVKSTLEAAFPLQIREHFKIDCHNYREMEALFGRFHQ